MESLATIHEARRLYTAVRAALRLSVEIATGRSATGRPPAVLLRPDTSAVGERFVMRSHSSAAAGPAVPWPASRNPPKKLRAARARDQGQGWQGRAANACASRGGCGRSRYACPWLSCVKSEPRARCTIVVKAGTSPAALLLHRPRFGVAAAAQACVRKDSADLLLCRLPTLQSALSPGGVPQGRLVYVADEPKLRRMRLRLCAPDRAVCHHGSGRRVPKNARNRHRAARAA